jgi:hypothetical protein
MSCSSSAPPSPSTASSGDASEGIDNLSQLDELPPVPGKRKRDQEAEDTIQEIESIKRQRKLSPETLQLAERVIDQARETIIDPDNGPEDTTMGRDMLKKILKEKDSLLKEKDSSRSLQFLLEAGDWAAAIVNPVRRQEKAMVNDMATAETKALQRKHPNFPRLPQADKNQINETVNKDPKINWKAMDGRADDVRARLSQDLQSISAWRASGEDPAKAPSTPYFDRMLEACKMANVKFDVFKAAVDLSTDRNNLAHNPPPQISQHLQPGPGNVVDWAALKISFEAAKNTVRKAHGNGYLDADQLKVFLKLIDGVFGTLQAPDPSTGVAKDTAETGHILKNHRDAQTAATKAARWIAPASPYHQGKWADVPK